MNCRATQAYRKLTIDHAAAVIDVNRLQGPRELQAANFPLVISEKTVVVLKILIKPIKPRA
jgi:hypothetical protein